MPSTVGIVASGEDVLNDAVFWVDAGRSSVVSGALSNLGTGGSALNAVFGNSTGVDSFDPALLTHTGTNYLYLPGVTGNYASTPDAASLQPATQIEMIARLSADDWTPAAPAAIIGKWTGSATPPALARSYQFFVTSSIPAGRLGIQWSDSTTSYLALSSVVPSFVDGNAYWLKATLNTNTGGNYEVKFFTAPDQSTEPSSWTQLGTTVTAGATGAIVYSTNVLEVGTGFGGTGNVLAGKFYRAIVRNGIGGTTVFDADFTTGITSGAQTTFTESSSNAATVTINRSTSGRKAVAVTRPILLFGTDDYLEVADNDLLDFAASDSFTVLLVHRAWATFATSAAGVAKKANATATTQGWLLSAGSTTAAQGQMQVGDGTNGTTAVSGSRTSGALSIVTAVRNVTADTVQTFLGNTGGTAITDATTTTSANAEVMRIGRLSGAGTGYSDFEVLAAAVWRRALNANEIATIVARYS